MNFLIYSTFLLEAAPRCFPCQGQKGACFQICLKKVVNLRILQLGNITFWFYAAFQFDVVLWLSWFVNSPKKGFISKVC